MTVSETLLVAVAPVLVFVLVLTLEVLLVALAVDVVVLLVLDVVIAVTPESDTSESIVSLQRYLIYLAVCEDETCILGWVTVVFLCFHTSL